MKATKPFTCRGVRTRKRSAAVALIAMLASTFSGNSLFTPTVVHAQSAPRSARGSLSMPATSASSSSRFTWRRPTRPVARSSAPDRSRSPTRSSRAACEPSTGRSTTSSPARSTRTASARPTCLPAPDDSGLQGGRDDALRSDGRHAGGWPRRRRTRRRTGFVADSQPRRHQQPDRRSRPRPNPAAVAAQTSTRAARAASCCGGGGEADPVTGSLFIPNITPDFGLSAPFNLAFAFFGQFFDHGLDLVTKGGGTVIMPLKADDPLHRQARRPAFHGHGSRRPTCPARDGIMGTADDVQEGINTTTPWVDQNQTYTSHPSHQVFLRQYALVGRQSRFRPAWCSTAGSARRAAPGSPATTSATSATGPRSRRRRRRCSASALVDTDVFNVPLLLTDPYGHFKPGPQRGMPQLVAAGQPGGAPRRQPGGRRHRHPGQRASGPGHAFLNDIAHNAVPGCGSVS